MARAIRLVGQVPNTQTNFSLTRLGVASRHGSSRTEGEGAGPVEHIDPAIDSSDWPEMFSKA